MHYLLNQIDVESFIRKKDGSANNVGKSSTMKIGKGISCGYLISTIWGSNHIEDKHSLYRGKYCMKKFFESLREHEKSIIILKRKKCYR